MSRCFRQSRKSIFTAVAVQAVLVCCLCSFFPGKGQARELFPLYPAIRSNVDFWEKVYSVYSLNSAVIHDRDDLSKVYEVVQLVDRGQPAADRINEEIVDFTIKKYQKILQRLAEGQSPSSAAERKVAALFTGPRAKLRMAQAAGEVRSQRGQKEPFYEGVVRSGAYIEAFRKIFRSRGLPAELAYLPHVESSFHTGAYSKVGAAGIWQFTRSTGKQYLQINDAVDERIDPFIAAAAAADYLAASYQKLGSWPLALTAYNYGTAGMVRAREAKGSYEKIFCEYREGYFGFASRNFYSEFLAALRVAGKLERSTTIPREKPVHFTEYILPGYIHITDVKRHFKISETTLEQLNPALRPPVYSGRKLLPKGYCLRLPPQRNVRSLASSLPRSKYSGSQSRDAVHRVTSGENALRIAARHRVSLKDLLAANDLKRDSKIFVGQRLRIPVAATRTSSKTQSSTVTTADIKRQTTAKSGTTTASGKTPLPVLSAEQSKIHKTQTR